jgi:TolA-binding protein
MSKVTSAKTKGRLTKKEMKQDRLVKLTIDLEKFYVDHQKLVLTVAVAVLVVIAGVILVRKSMESSRLEAAYKVTMAKASFGSGQLDNAAAAFQTLATSGSGVVAAESKYFLGRIAYEQGKYSQAVDEFNGYFKDFSGTDELNVGAYAGLGSSYEALEKYADAAQEYQKAADKYPKNPAAVELLMDAARVYQKLNQPEKAIPLLRKIRDSYPESSLAQQARQQLASLE